MARISLRSTRCQRRTCSCGVSRLRSIEATHGRGASRRAQAAARRRGRRGQRDALEEVEEAHGHATRGAARRVRKAQVPRRTRTRAEAGGASRRRRSCARAELLLLRVARAALAIQERERHAKMTCALHFARARSASVLRGRSRRHAPQAWHRRHPGHAGVSGARFKACSNARSHPDASCAAVSLPQRGRCCDGDGAGAHGGAVGAVQEQFGSFRSQIPVRSRNTLARCAVSPPTHRFFGDADAMLTFVRPSRMSTVQSGHHARPCVPRAIPRHVRRRRRGPAGQQQGLLGGDAGLRRLLL
jgi:hypothetical protein